MKRTKTLGWNGKTFRFDRSTKAALYRAAERFQAKNPHLTFATIIDMAIAALFAPHHPDFRTMLDADLIGTEINFSCLHDSEKKNENCNKQA